MLFKNILALFLVNFSLAKIINLDWTVEEKKIAPDNYGFDGMTINGQFPGPTINGTMGDIVLIRLRNNLHKNFTIHWHGLVQKGTPMYDGVPYVSQDPIQPGTSFLYYFELSEQVGTHWYHAHTGLDAEHAFGALLIQDKPEDLADLVSYNNKYQYDEERLIILSEVWHTPSEKLIEGLVGPDFHFVGSADSILINGQVHHEWDNKDIDNSTLPFNKGNHIINVEPNKTYRLRLIGALGFEKMKFSIPGHKFTIIEADGTYIEPFEVEYMEVFGGQRYSVLLKTDQPVNNYVIYAQRTGETKLSFVSKAILSYKGAADPQSLVRANLPNPSPSGIYNRWAENELSASKWNLRNRVPHYYPVPQEVTKHIYLNSTPVFIGKHVDELINGIHPKKRDSALMTELINNTHHPDNSVIEINEGDVVQIVMEHFLPAGFPGCLHHPWHLHGHSFHVVASGKEKFNPEIDNPKIDANVKSMKNAPPFVDTFTHYPKDTAVCAKTRSNDFYERLRDAVEKDKITRANTEPALCGWYAIRFKANNPGPWYMHCHISGHLVMGKVVIINENPKDPKAFSAKMQSTMDKANSYGF